MAKNVENYNTKSRENQGAKTNHKMVVVWFSLFLFKNSKQKNIIWMKNAPYLYILVITCISYIRFCFFRPPVREDFPNHEVVMFQPWTGTSPYLGSVDYFYLLYFLVPPFIFLLPPDVRPRGQPTPTSPLKPSPSAQSVPAQYRLPTWVSPVSVP